MANRILGGEFTSRINMNLRENKGWSYGAFSINIDAVGPGFFSGYAPVQTDKTKESIAEMRKEISQFVSEKPATEQEYKKVQRNAVLQLPGIWETNSSILYTLQDAIKYERGESYLDTYASRIQGLTLDDIKKAATKVVKPKNLTWVIVGDRSKIENGVKELNLGPIKYINSEGKELQ
jgi:predicted Zn-dependent peptidase